MPDTLTVIARFRAKPGMRDEVRDDLVAMIEPSLAEVRPTGVPDE